ncbi:MAG: response regulator [Clostridia bacterium]|nr:response regulator [Clostridia bacterium]
MRILLAEDEKALSKAIVKIFEKNNYSADGEDALAYLETGCYDAAVLDIMMPKADGITVLRKLSGGKGVKASADRRAQIRITLNSPRVKTEAVVLIFCKARHSST